MKLLLTTLLLTFSFQLTAQDWKKETEEWKISRVEALKQPHGWLSLIGMEWLNQGDNTIGSAKDNSIVLPHGTAHLGNFIVSGKSIDFIVKDDAAMTANDKSISNRIQVKMDSSGEPTVFKVDTFLFYVIERGKPALRIKDSLAETRIQFKGLDYFPLSDDFRLKAEFHPYTPIKEVEIINVLGLLSKETSPGYLSFELEGQPLKLDVLDAGDDYYVIFADKTSGRSTYGPGRFLYVAKAKEDKQLYINFNRAYNPPCAFTDYSTCPLPPAQNRLPVFIKAGEKAYHH